jgi:urease accessory protein
MGMGTMTDAHPMLALAAFFSPSFPTGGFAYSGGLETAVARSGVATTEALETWLRTLIANGAIHNDGVLFAEAWRRASTGGDISALAELATALCASMERQAETTNQGAAFLRASRPWTGEALECGELPYPVAAGLACAHAGVGLAPGLQFFLQSLVSNQLQAAIRLSVTGQDGAGRLLAGLAPAVAAEAAAAADSTLADLGTGAFLADIASLAHETLETRLFLS